MQNLLNQLLESSPEPWGTVLVIGARPSSNLDLLRSLRARRLVLTQAQPEQASALAKSVDSSHGEEVLAVAVAEPGRAGQVKLQVCNLPRFNSFTAHAALSTLLPNLRVVNEIEVPAVSLQSVVQDANLDPKQRNLLVVEAPGQLEALNQRSAALEQFSNLIVVAGEEPLYEGDIGISELLGRLHKAGFDDVAGDPDAIYPLTIRALQRNPTRVELRKLEVRSVRLTQERDAAIDKAAKQEQEAERLQGEVAKYKGEAEDYKAQKERLEAEQSDLKSELTQSKAELEKLQEEAVRARDEQKKLVEQAARADAAVAENAELGKKVQMITAERDREAKNEESRIKQTEELEQRVAKLEAELADSAGATALAIRMQTLRENDLGNLRERYGKLHNEYEAQRKLLTKISYRLVAANQYFQQLAITENSKADNAESSRQQVISGQSKEDGDPVTSRVVKKVAEKRGEKMGSSDESA